MLDAQRIAEIRDRAAIAIPTIRELTVLCDYALAAMEAEKILGRHLGPWTDGREPGKSTWDVLARLRAARGAS